MKKLVVFVIAILLTGCASIVSKSEWPVSIQTNPPGAECAIFKVNGPDTPDQILHRGTTPVIVVLDSASGYFKPAKYNVECYKEGYYSSSLSFSASWNGWYAGNILFGWFGIVGALVVDPMTGAMWRLDDTRVINLQRDYRREFTLDELLR